MNKQPKKPKWLEQEVWDKIQNKNKSKVSIKGLLALQVINKFFPKFSKRSLAEKLVQDFPHIYNDAEDARNYVRYYTGSKGDDSKIYKTHL